MAIELAPRRADEDRDHVEEIDRPVRNDRPRNERDAVLPREDDRADAIAPAGQPIRESVAREEERAEEREPHDRAAPRALDRKSTRLNSSHVSISYAVFCLKKKKKKKKKNMT